MERSARRLVVWCLLGPACDGRHPALDSGETGSAPDACQPMVGYPDRDKDGFGDSDFREEGCHLADDLTPVAGDCDDTDAAVFPGAPELCNAVDDDCDGVPDDDAEGPIVWRDADGDGDGDPSVHAIRCGEAGWSATYTDCDDADPAVSACTESRSPQVEVVSGDDLRMVGAPFGFPLGAWILGDLDGDQIDDLVVSNAELVLFHSQPGNGPEEAVYSADAILIHGGLLYGVASAGDVDQDGDVDLAVAMNDVLAVFAAPIPSGLFDTSSATAVLTAESRFESAVAAGDPDGDGSADLWVLDYEAYQIERYDVGRQPFVDEPEVTDVGNHGIASLATGDLDGDGALELMIGAWEFTADGRREAGQVWVLDSDVPAAIDPEHDAMVTLFGENEDSWVGVSVASGDDLDGDGSEDLGVATGDDFSALLYRPAVGEWPIASAANVVFAGEELASSGAIQFPGDLDGDGFGDVVLTPYSGSLFVAPGPFAGTIDLATLDRWEGSTAYPIGDLDGDGSAEAVFTDSQAGVLYIVTL